MFFSSTQNVLPKEPSKDIFDILTEFVTTRPRDLFKAFNYLFFWNQFFTGKDSFFYKNSLSTLPKIFFAFDFVDFIENSNNLKNYLLGKNIEAVKDPSLLIASTVESGCDAISWATSTTGLIAIGSYASSWITSIGGATLAYCFAKYTLEVIKDLKNKTLNNDERTILFYKLAKNISLFALGVIFFSIGWFSLSCFSTAIALFSTVTVVSELAIHLIKNQKHLQKA
jgi:hypothetical protein